MGGVLNAGPSGFVRQLRRVGKKKNYEVSCVKKKPERTIVGSSGGNESKTKNKRAGTEYKKTKRN